MLQTRLGLCVATQQLMRVKRAGLLFSGLPCSSFIWLNRGTTHRSADNPDGSPYVPTACFGNLLAARFALLALTGIIRGVWWVCEQPSSSLAVRLRVMQWLLRVNSIHLFFQPGSIKRLWLACMKMNLQFLKP